MADRSDELARRDAASKKANIQWVLLIERINQASADGYDVLNPDVLADALWNVGAEQIAAGQTDFVKRCELFAHQYETHRKAIDRKFPRRIAPEHVK